MPTSSTTPPAENAQKSTTGSRARHVSTRVDETILQPGILDQLQDAVFTTDLHGVITSCNQGVSRYGFAAEGTGRPKDG
jgi:PAS domain-containing protein